jgi:hypothetical protein
LQGALGDQREHHPLGHLDGHRRPPDRRADTQPLPQPICVHAPPNQREATISTSPPRAAAAACSGVYYREIDATSRASAAWSTWPASEVVDHLGDRVSGLRVRYLVEYAGSSPAQNSQLHEEQLDERYRADNRAQAERQKAGRRSYGKERTARTHPHMRL